MLPSWARRVLMPTLASLSLAGGCSSSTGTSAPAPAALVVLPVAWNPANLDVGTVQAVAEQDASVLVFGSKGIQTLAGGSLVGSDETITSWRSAAVIPSAGGLSTWTVGVDDGGHVQRVPANGAPQDVSDRYGLATDKVEDVVAGTGRVAFLLDGGLAMTDGVSVTRYDATARSIAATAGLVAVADGGVVRIFDQGKESDVTLPDAQRVAYDGARNLMVATTHALYQVNAGLAQVVYDAGTRTIHGLTSAGSNVWVQVDGDLGVWQGGRFSVASGGALAPDAKLIGSTSGDVWVISGGLLLRWATVASAGAAGAGDEATWNTTVQPVYASVCSNCHSPSGSGKDSSHIDLSTYAAWNNRRAAVYARAVSQAGTAAQMPPPGSGFTLDDAQRSAIAAWSKP